MKRIAWLIFTNCVALALCANPRLPRIFGNNMVFQRGIPISIWGWKDKDEKIVIKFNHQTVEASEPGEKWYVRLAPEKEGGPYKLSVSGNQSIMLTNVMVGEVWLCSGQSNMEMPIAGWGRINQFQQEIDEAKYPMIREIKVPNTVSAIPLDDLSGGEWLVCSPQTAGDFTAAGYFFARELYKRLHVPVGLINCTWGGTMIEAWISRQGLEGSAEFRPIIQDFEKTNLPEMARQKSEHLISRIDSLQGKYEPGESVAAWKDPGFDDSHWPNMKLPGYWESQGIGLEDLDGDVWFRRTVDLPSEAAGKEAVLHLSKIDDSDDSYVNGVRVGSMQSRYSELRVYKVPAGVLKAGRNVFAVRVEDTGGGGGIYGDPADMRVEIDGKSYPLAGNWAFRVEKAISSGPGPNSAPTLLFNGMVNPLVPFGIKGVLWYQGEANTGRSYQYRIAFPLMITDWRSHWQQGDFPFYFVQLSSFNAANGNSRQGSGWAELREAQDKTLSLPKTGMAVTTDIGNPIDVHPKNKQEVGRRLAAIALANCYGQSVEFSGPVFQRMQTEDDKAVLSFTHATGGMVARDSSGILRGFEIAGADSVFYPAKASINGENRVVVKAAEVLRPVAVRYAWADDAGDANLFNKAGLPARPFRTDNWKGLTDNEKYVLGK